MKSSSASPWALILAAGESRRFGGQKLLAPAGGRPVIEWTLTALAEARARGLLAGVMVVVRARDRQLREFLPPDIEQVILTAGSAPALSDSLRAGIAALASRDTPGVAAVLICLADQPGLRSEVIASLVEEWRRGQGPVLRPRYAEAPEEPGHPLLLDRSAWPMVETLQGDVGLGAALKGGEQPVHSVEVVGANPDIDRPEDLDRFLRAPR